MKERKYNEIRRTYIDLDHQMCMLYEPLHKEGKSRVGIVLMHSDSNYFEFAPAIALAERGYTCIASNVQDPHETLDRKVYELSAVVTYLRNYPGIEKVLLLGHSGGATLVSAYQSIAENGVGIFQGPEKIIAFDDLKSLLPPFIKKPEGEITYSPADGVMFMDANFGNGIMSLLSLDPSIKDETSGMENTCDPSLDMFNPENGYDPDGSHYSQEFLDAFRKAQGDRMNRLISYCQDRVAAIERGEGKFVDDEPLYIPGATQFAPNNKLFPQLPEMFFSHTENEWTLIHKDGSTTRQIVPCLRPRRGGHNMTPVNSFSTLDTTVRTFLKSSAVHVNNLSYTDTQLLGVDLDSSYCITIGNVAHISAPILTLGMTGSYEYIAAEHIWRRAKKCRDITVGFVEGAGHNFEAEHQIEQTPHEYGDTIKSCFDFADDWISERFL